MRAMRIAISSVLLGLFVAGCGGAGSKGPVNYTKGPMPEGGQFDGVYQSDFGRLEITVEDNGNAVGLYEDDQHYGRLEGHVEGKLLFFKWTQWTAAMQGKFRETDGHGVFEYTIESVMLSNGKTKDYHKLAGWWAYEDGQLTNPWNSQKLSARAKKRLKPFDPASSGGDLPAAVNSSAGFEDVSDDSEGERYAEEEDVEEEDDDSLDDLF